MTTRKVTTSILATALMTLGAIKGTEMYQEYSSNQAVYKTLPKCFMHKSGLMLVMLTEDTKTGYKGLICNQTGCMAFTDTYQVIQEAIKVEFPTEVDCETEEVKL